MRIHCRWLLTAAALCGAAQAGRCEMTPDQSQLWNKTVTPLLRDDLWTSVNKYDAAHDLMVPMHFAFREKGASHQKEFSAFAARFMQEGADLPEKNALNRTQFAYLLSQYLTLKSETGFTASDQALARHLMAEQRALWQDAESVWYENMKFKGLEAQLTWQLNTPSPKRHYFLLISDATWFALAVSSDLYRLHLDPAFDAYYRQTLAPLLRQTLHRYLVFQPDGGWLYLPGVWSDHRDYLYAGQEKKGVDLAPKPLSDATLDSSHLVRFPLWLQSWQAVADVFPAERAFMDRASQGLEKQLFSKMLVKRDAAHPYYRMTNYMDGRNGLFRWQYETVGKNDGYGPYELSGTLLLGWWTFLPGGRINQVYGDVARSFPLPSAAINLYVGPNTTRERHPLMTWPDAFSNGLMKLIASLAAQSCLD